MLHNAKKRNKLQTAVRIAMIACAGVMVFAIILNLAVSEVQYSRLNKIQAEASAELADIVNLIEFTGLDDEVKERIARYNSRYTGYSNFIVIDDDFRVLYALNQGFMDGTDHFYVYAHSPDGYYDATVLYILDGDNNPISSHSLYASNRISLGALTRAMADRLAVTPPRQQDGGAADVDVGASDPPVASIGSGESDGIFSLGGSDAYPDSSHSAEYYGFPSKNMHLIFIHDNTNPVYITALMSMESSRVAINIVTVAGVIGGIAYWLLTAVWVFLDAGRRDSHPGLWGVLTLFTNVVGLIIYLVVRPELQQCPACKEPVKADYIVCPLCGARNRETCAHCGRIVDENWNACPYCAASIERDAPHPQEGAAT